jgi:hypothetical protein
MPALAVVRDPLIAGFEHGYADLDWSALGLVAADAAGLTTPGLVPATSNQRSVS